MESIKSPANFANESAKRIIDELRESDGFYNSNEIPSAFIQRIMCNDVDEKAIRNRIANQIINDLKSIPSGFTYDSENIPIYDSSMRNDYEGVAVKYIREKFEEEVKESVECTGMTIIEGYEFALEIFKKQEGRKPNLKGLVSADERAVAILQVGIVETLKKFGLFIS